MNGQSEGDALSDWLEGEFVDIDGSYMSEAQLRTQARARNTAKRVAKLRARYKAAKAARVGEIIECAFCGRRIIKTTYHKAFCSNGKTRKGAGGNCKDRYWNTVDEVRRERAVFFN